MASLPPTKKNWVVQQTLVRRKMSYFSKYIVSKIQEKNLAEIDNFWETFYIALIFEEKLATYWEKDTLYFLSKVVWMTFLWDVPTIGLVIELNTCPSKTSFGSTHFLEKKLLFFYSLLWENVPFWKLSSQILSSNNIIKVFPRRGKCCAVRW